MNISYNVKGPERKRLVQAIAEITECDAEYLGVPSCAYRVGNYTVDKEGCLSFDDMSDSDEVEMLVERLCDAGFEAEIEEEVPGLTVSLPRSLFSGQALENLSRLIEAKGNLIRQALGIEELPVETDDDKVSFPWFEGEPTSEEVKAYSHFISALCELARNQKRVTASEKETENPKYAFRCFLLRLGFIGDEYRTERKILMRNLSGSSAFKSGSRNGACIPTPENTVKIDVELAKERLKDPEVQAEIRALFSGEDGEQE